MTTHKQPSIGQPDEHTAADDSYRCRSALSIQDVQDMREDEQGGRACIAWIAACWIVFAAIGACAIAIGVSI